MSDTDGTTPSTHDSHDNPYEAGAAQARAFGFEQIARAFDELVPSWSAPAEEPETQPRD